MNFKKLLNNGQLDMVLEAHNGLSAKVVNEAGYNAIWASGLSISSSLGLRDCNEASWSQVLDIVESIYDATEIPILFDGDSGYGNFNNVRQIVKRLSHYGIGGISLEDKNFPKMNSFIGEDQLLVPYQELAGKIKAAQDIKKNDDFVVIARTESLIAGLGVDEALERANHYCDAGADAIFIHSKQSDGQEIIDFAKQWNKRLPLIVAPTTYTSLPIEVLEELGVSIYLCANHLMRASLFNMRIVAKLIREKKSINGIDQHISSLEDVFSFLNYKELDLAENKYSH